MKKILSVILAGIAILLVGCSDIATNGENGLLENSHRRQTLAFYASIGNYTASQDEMESNLVSFLTNSENNRSVANVSNYEFSLVATDTVETAKNVTARSANVDSYDDVDLYLYDIKNTADGTDGFAITSTDRRIGTVLAFVPQGVIDETEENPFLEDFFDNLEEYIDETVEIWNDLSDKEIRESRSAATSIVTSGKYTFSNWQYNSGNARHILKTNWDQWTPYNSIVNKKKNDGQNYPTGCGPTALAQLLANLEYPKQCSLSEYLCSGVQYNWSLMKANKNANYVSTSAKNMIAVLMYELGKGLNASYTASGTSCSNSDVENYLKKNGYSYSGFKGYNLSSIQSSIDNGYPVLAQGAAKKITKKKKIFGITYRRHNSYAEGHYWIIDGYARLSCDATNKSSGAAEKITENFLHCNLGWSGSCNGYYLNGVFDTRNVPVEYSNGSPYDTKKQKWYFQYNLHILTDLHHN